MKGDGLFVQVGTGYARDDRVAEAGFVAELLSIRAAQFCKEKPTDGDFTRTQLVRFIGPDLPEVEDHAERLVEVGLWERTAKGYVIVGWLEDNPSVVALRALSEQRSEAGRKSGHNRGGHPGEFEDCEICNPGARNPRSEQGVQQRVEPEKRRAEPEENRAEKSNDVPVPESGDSGVVASLWSNLIEQGMRHIGQGASKGVIIGNARVLEHIEATEGPFQAAQALTSALNTVSSDHRASLSGRLRSWLDESYWDDDTLYEALIWDKQAIPRPTAVRWVEDGFHLGRWRLTTGDAMTDNATVHDDGWRQLDYIEEEPF